MRSSGTYSLPLVQMEPLSSSHIWRTFGPVSGVFLMDSGPSLLELLAEAAIHSLASSMKTAGG